MLDCNGNPTKGTLARFISRTTGKSYEESCLEFSKPKMEFNLKPPTLGRKLNPLLKPRLLPVREVNFDFRSLVKETPFNPLGSPSKSQVADFMVEQTRCSLETALIKLSMPKLTKLR